MAKSGGGKRPKIIRGVPRALGRTLERHPGELDLEVIRSAFELAEEAHSEQRRASGAPFVSHAVEVAAILADLQLDTETIAAALVHDVVEDTVVSLQAIRELLGDDVAAIVDGVTKIGQVDFRSQVESQPRKTRRSKKKRQVDNYRKLIVSTSKDVRVIFVKLADRLHNMRTLEHLPPAKRRPIAEETQKIYAPLAHRLGMGKIKWELEDLSFKFLQPDEYGELQKLVRQRRRSRERAIATIRVPLERELAELDFRSEVTGRPKHLWSIHRKMEGQQRAYDDIYDVMAVRVITQDVHVEDLKHETDERQRNLRARREKRRCYEVLAIVHAMWDMVPGRLHDYVSKPKSNGYSSLHTTVQAKGGMRFEIQIRTRRMHETAEYGVAAHWRYKERGARSTTDEMLADLARALEWQDDEEFLEHVKMTLYDGEIFVFTPRGDVKRLPEGSTPIDFAFAVHTEVGLQCNGARVNGKIVPLSRKLRTSEVVEIITHKRQRPSRNWLGFVKSSRARTAIRRWIRETERESALRLGRQLFKRELRKARRRKPAEPELAASARRLGYASFEAVLEALARGDVDPAAVIRGIYPKEEPSEVVKRPRSRLHRIADRIRKSNRGISIHGVDNLLTTYSRCCQPVPGDEAIGYITRGRGLSVHRADCANLLRIDADPAQLKRIDWTVEKEERIYVALRMEGTDRMGLLGDVGRTISDTGTNIENAAMKGKEGGMVARFVVGVNGLDHLKRVIDALRRVKGVTKVERRETMGEADFKELVINA